MKSDLIRNFVLLFSNVIQLSRREWKCLKITDNDKTIERRTAICSLLEPLRTSAHSTRYWIVPDMSLYRNAPLAIDRWVYEWVPVLTKFHTDISARQIILVQDKEVS
jgi:hypothetical protein